ncbi:MAG: hypothetical protein OEW62_04320 [Candidatus Bathyarchaeota archaeon]|nr:hypothetical protein [Candidatus Bathyarchaeota archaeon]
MTEKLASYKKKNKLMSGYQLKFTNGSLAISKEDQWVQALENDSDNPYANSERTAKNLFNINELTRACYLVLLFPSDSA